MTTKPAAAAPLITRVPLGDVSPEASLVLEIRTTAPSHINREFLVRLDRVRALICDDAIDMDGALLMLMAFRHHVDSVRVLVEAKQLGENGARAMLRAGP